MTDLSKPLFTPHLDDPNVLHMGLQKISSQQWLQPDLEAKLFYQHKCEQYQQNSQRVYQAEDATQAAQREFAEILLAHLLVDHSGVFQRNGDVLCAPQLDLKWQLTGEENLWQSSLWIADDVCLMLPDGDDYRLAAASLCSPSQWYLAEKFGQSLSAIHQPIPDFQRQLTPSVSRFFHHFKADYVIQRFNWSVQPHTELRWQDEKREPVEQGAPIYWRVERQTLRRLPKTQAVAFTIKVYNYPLAELAAIPNGVAALQQAIAQCPEKIADYKRFDRYQAVFAAYL